MKGIAKPIRSTIAWGLISGLIYLPLSLIFNSMAFWPLSFQLLLWTLLAGYGVLLSCWASKPLASVALPLLLLLFAAFLIQSTATFLLAALGMLSWMRSGICFNQTSVVKRFVAETGLGLSSGLPVAASVPAATLTGTLGVWLFFLIQALYFVVFEYRNDPATRVELDPFERAKMAAEQILSN